MSNMSHEWRDTALRPYDEKPGPHVPQRHLEPEGVAPLWQIVMRLLRGKKPVQDRQYPTPRNWR